VIRLVQNFHTGFQDSGDLFEQIMSISGEVYRQSNGRKTQKFCHAGKHYFLKSHVGVGWKEIIKNLVQLRWPVLGADNEWRAIQRLPELGIDTMKLVGYGRKGWNPARLRSFIITEELHATQSLEDFCQVWRTTPCRSPDALRLKRALIRKVAQVARLLHVHGLNHRDFYLCHFLLEQSSAGEASRLCDPRLYLIDLHRVQIRKRTPRRWAVKDIGSLYFSSMNIGLTQRDLYRFMKSYRNRNLRNILQEEPRFWWAIKRRAASLYHKAYGCSAAP
jgi:hypothetical protein